jgi:hypothetical protein
MKMSEFVWMPYSDNQDDYRNFVANLAITENWGQDFRYLQDYVRDNFEIAYRQGKVKEESQKRYCLWRVGTLTTREGEPISILAAKNRLSGKQPYVFKFVFDRQRFTVRIDNEEFAETAPDVPQYDTPEYHQEYRLTYNFSHYLEDHESRVADRFPNLNAHQRFLCIYAALELAHRRAMQSAVPQWFCDHRATEGEYQWLLPLHITSEDIDERPDFVAVLSPVDEFEEYNVPTIMPPQWAYGHARAVSGRDPQFRTWG